MFSVFEWFVLVLWFDTFVLIVLSDEPRQNQGRGLVNHKLVTPPRPPPTPNFIAGRPEAAEVALLFRFFGDLDVACCYLWLFSLYINIKIGKNSC